MLYSHVVYFSGGQDLQTNYTQNWRNVMNSLNKLKQKERR